MKIRLFKSKRHTANSRWILYPLILLAPKDSLNTSKRGATLKKKNAKMSDMRSRQRSRTDRMKRKNFSCRLKSTNSTNMQCEARRHGLLFPSSPEELLKYGNFLAELLKYTQTADKHRAFVVCSIHFYIRKIGQESFDQ